MIKESLYKAICMFCFVCILVLCAPARAQWTEPVLITESEYLMMPRVVAIGDTLHVVGERSLTYYLRSHDNGLTWTEPVIPADAFYCSEMPDIVSSNNYIHLTFIGRSESGQHLQAFFMSSSDGGRTWGEPHEVFHNNNSALFKYPRLAVKNDTLFFSCLKSPYLLTFRSFDNGVTWQDSTIVENGPIFINSHPNILFSNERLHLIYALAIVGDSLGIEIYHRYSDDYGLTWSDRFPLSEPEPSPNVEHGQRPSAYADSAGNIIAAWFDYKYGSYCGVTGDILARISTDNGNTWLPESRITYTQSGSGSSCVILNNKIYIAWMDCFPLGCSCPKIMYSESEDWGSSWTEPEVISGTAETREYSPVLVYTVDLLDTVFHCVISGYYDDTPRFDLFYFRSEEFTSVEFDENNILPKDLEISIYPNPFNSSVTFRLSDYKGGDVRIEIYDIAGRLVNALYTDSYGKAMWEPFKNDCHCLSSGIYFIKPVLSGNYHPQKILFLK